MKKGIKKIGGIALAGVLLTGIAASSAWAEEEKPTADLSVSFLSKYVWRGWEFSKDSMVIEPSMTVGYKGFAFNIWGNLDTDEHEFLGGVDEDSSSWNETDLTLSYDASCDFADYGVGLIYYAVDGFEDTQELYVTASLKTILAPTLTIYRDYDVADSWYVTFDISHSFAINETMSLDLGAKVSYYDYDDEDDLADPDDASDAYSAFHDGVISASMTFPIGDYMSLTPELYYSFPLSSEAEDVIEAGSANGDDSDFVYGGLTFSMSF
ncbi:MAG: hypothetical protein KQH63_18015 [Desulfobulbaceae bacterium]|nr:hypothetical protein [Desulfobulbaceae bacterium]